MLDSDPLRPIQIERALKLSKNGARELVKTLTSAGLAGVERHRNQMLIRAGPDALPDDPGEVFADCAYCGSHFCDAVRVKGGTSRIVATGMWGRDEQATLPKLKEWNQSIHRVRGRIEKIFGTWKRNYGLRRMPLPRSSGQGWRGLAKAAVQIHLTAIAYNLKRTLNIVQQTG